MQYHDFVGTVQQRARLGTTEQAVGAIRATLATLGERLAGGEADHLASQLPTELGRYLTSGNGPRSEGFDLESFYQHVQRRERAELPDSVHHAHVVLGVLQEAVTPGEWQHVCAQLPEEYGDLIEGAQETARAAQREQQQPQHSELF